MYTNHNKHTAPHKDTTHKSEKPMVHGHHIKHDDKIEYKHHTLPAPTAQGTEGFLAIPLIEPLQRALAKEGYVTPSPIQAQSIPTLLAGKDLLGSAQTGTGKTAAFLLPILQHLVMRKGQPIRNRPRALILAPTRELAAQIDQSISAYGRYVQITHTAIYGGVGQHPQVSALARGVDIAVATPGRLMDLMEQGHVRLDNVEFFVLDEADRMLDMGFIPDIRRIISSLPHKRQSLFFSATMSPQILQLADSMLKDPVRVTIAPSQPTVERIVQKVLFVDKANKDALLIKLLRDSGMNRVIVFTQMKHVANKVVEKLDAARINAVAIHGNKTQSARTQALAAFKAGKVRVLVATDIAARGIDVDNITHVVNYDLPTEAESYIHRIGRTARAGSDGDAISFCSAEERQQLRDIERLIKKAIPVDEQQPFHSEIARNATGSMSRPPPRQQFQRRGPPRSSKPSQFKPRRR